jgi:site-specific recombinase XerD
MPIVTKLPSGRYRVQWRDRSGRKVGPTPSQTFPTEKIARTYGLDREAEVRRGQDFDPDAGRVLLKTWIEAWLDNRVAEPRTLSKIRGHLNKHVLQPVGDGPALGDMRLEQVDEMALQAWVKRLQTSGLAPSTITGIFTTLQSVLRAALRARRIQRDPTVDVVLPTIPPPSDFYWEREELDAIRAQLTTPADRALFEVLAGTGIRWGEAAGLHLPRWVPLRRRLQVVEVLSEDDRTMVIKEYPKGKKRRDLPAVDPRLLEAVAEHLAVNAPIRCGLHRTAKGTAKPCPGLLFHDGTRALSRHGWPRMVFAEAVEAAKVRRGTVHDLRHTYASHLVIDGVPLRVVQELLGHASIRTTERYSHLAPTTLDDPTLLASLTGRTAARRESERESHG